MKNKKYFRIFFILFLMFILFILFFFLSYCFLKISPHTSSVKEVYSSVTQPVTEVKPETENNRVEKITLKDIYESAFSTDEDEETKARTFIDLIEMNLRGGAIDIADISELSEEIPELTYKPIKKYIHTTKKQTLKDKITQLKKLFQQ
ncbi:hypothetical protein FEF22_002110 [Texas Phoenix palm phytoplasma]|uniref:Uncharacterized protein n=1 Tax=Texas Phoenix palm phytoplasma TaxID=176709 RepID=A0ABS5BIY6_9MOLU|nr:hypothetical protein [Texas Phoenix palm phytoplasma]MBP3059292.1 hypothetical protein [Texas Phoenix palm phytoplasma]MBP3059559.1 hypothetical protein [Texas Phoenix palm phytoplasma]